MADIKENMVENNQNEESVEISVEQKLLALYTLQQVDSQIDKIKNYRGELPLEVQDLEDEVAGLETRINNLREEEKKLTTDITNYKIKIKETESLIKKYEDQQNNVRNNREYDSLSKEIEYQSLEIQLCEKRIRENTVKVGSISERIKEADERLQERRTDLDLKRTELKNIVEETEKDEQLLLAKSKECEMMIEDRLLIAYKRIRKNARNGLAVVQIQRDACAGCFNKIPPQHQLDICMHKKIIVCEYCGRILVDAATVNNYERTQGES